MPILHTLGTIIKQYKQHYVSKTIISLGRKMAESSNLTKVKKRLKTHCINALVRFLVTAEKRNTLQKNRPSERRLKELFELKLESKRFIELFYSQ